MGVPGLGQEGLEIDGSFLAAHRPVELAHHFGMALIHYGSRGGGEEVVMRGLHGLVERIEVAAQLGGRIDGRVLAPGGRGYRRGQGGRGEGGQGGRGEEGADKIKRHENSWVPD